MAIHRRTIKVPLPLVEAIDKFIAKSEEFASVLLEPPISTKKSWGERCAKRQDLQGCNSVDIKIA
jgi:hypothetical protein